MLNSLMPLLSAVGFSLLLVYLAWVLVPQQSELLPVSQSEPQVVAVTGASGFLAGNVVQQLIDRGYRVRGSVRSLKNPHKVAHLRRQFPALELYEADLLLNGSFAAMFEGATYVVHTASPFFPQVPDPQRDLIDPALMGTVNVLTSAMESPTVRRVVLTSSMAAVSSDKAPEDRMRRWTEADWNYDSTILTNPYRLSKRLAEEAAWKMVREHPERHLELVALNPSFIIGPPLSNRSDATSIATVKGFLEGKFYESGAAAACFGAVDVRDVARAHLLAMETPQAAGNRFILSSAEAYSQLELAQMLASEYGDWPLPTKQQAVPAYCPRMDNSKVQKVLKLKFNPVPNAIMDMGRQIVKLKIATKPDWHKPSLGLRLSVALRRAGKKALGGGFAGAMAMVVQVLTLMWLRTAMNYQYRYGHTTMEVLRILYQEGGVGRFYQGLVPALIQGPLSRFCDTAANSGTLALLEAFVFTAALPLGIRTLMASAVAASFRIFLMPVDALKTTMQVEGKTGPAILLRKVADNGISVLFAGALASIAAGFVGHYPWFLTFNCLNAWLPKATSFSYKIIRNAAIGTCATICSDSCSNSLRVVKTTVQTSSVPVTYTQVVTSIWKQDGFQGFCRGLKTRMLVNVLQGALFSVVWRMLVDWMSD